LAALGASIKLKVNLKMKLLVFVVTVAFHIVFLIDESSLHKVIVRTCFDINLPLLFVSFISLLFVVVVVNK
jgi:hypothetical protein